MLNNLKTKVAIITGGASGIGKEIAEKFASYKAKAVVAAFDTNALTGQSIIASHGWHIQ